MSIGLDRSIVLEDSIEKENKPYNSKLVLKTIAFWTTVYAIISASDMLFLLYYAKILPLNPAASNIPVTNKF